MKKEDLCEKPFTIKRVIGLLEDINGFRIKDELPFNTCDYYEIEGCIEYLKSLSTKKSLNTYSNPNKKVQD